MIEATIEPVEGPRATTPWLGLNASLAFPGLDGKYDLDADRKAVKSYFVNHINTKMQFFHDWRERMHYCLENGYYDRKVVEQYSEDDLASFFKQAYAYRFRFVSLIGASKFYSNYAMQTVDGTRYLERFEDRIVMCAIDLAMGDVERARKYIDVMMLQVYQPATPTFSNTGKLRGGDLVSCFLIEPSDCIEDIERAIASVGLLSKRGGGVAVCLTNCRAAGAPIKEMLNRCAGLIPIAKLAEGEADYVDQQGTRDGACVVYTHACHYDAPDLIDTKRENADEKVRLKTLSIGLVVPDIMYELAARNKDIYLFCPYDVKRVYGIQMSKLNVTKHYKELVSNPEIRKRKVNARRYFQTISFLQGQSGFPFIMNEDTVNRLNPLNGWISMSNLCTEILQPSSPSVLGPDMSYIKVGRDISCNLGSINAVNAMRHGPQFGDHVETAVRMLTAVSVKSTIGCVPSIDNGNNLGHAIGLGVMNLHALFATEGLMYGSEASCELTDLFYATLRFHAIRASCLLAKESGTYFDGFKESKYYTGEVFEPYTERDWSDISPEVADILSRNGFSIPDASDWAALKALVHEHGMFNQNLLATAPTGSISYVNNSTASIAPIAERIESRKEGLLGRCYYPAPHMTNENAHLYKDVYELGYKAVIDVYAAATPHVDQGLSCTLCFLKEFTTTATLDEARNYAWEKGLKTTYYMRIRSEDNDDFSALAANQNIKECLACAV